MKASTIVIIVLVILIMYIIIKWATDKVIQLCYKERSGVRIAPIPGNKLGKEQGPNFSFSLWFYISSWQNSNFEKVLLLRESDTPSQGDTLPGTQPSFDFKIALGRYKNTLTTTVKIQNVMGDAMPADVSCKIDEVPLQKWVHVLVSTFGKTLDTYINGKLERTCILDNVVKVNPESSVYVNPLHEHTTSDGNRTSLKTWDGWVANGRYYPYYLNPQEVWNIYKEGYDSGGFGGVLEKYRIKFVFLVGNEEKGAFMI